MTTRAVPAGNPYAKRQRETARSITTARTVGASQRPRMVTDADLAQVTSTAYATTFRTYLPAPDGSFAARLWCVSGATVTCRLRATELATGTSRVSAEYATPAGEHDDLELDLSTLLGDDETRALGPTVITVEAHVTTSTGVCAVVDTWG